MLSREASFSTHDVGGRSGRCDFLGDTGIYLGRESASSLSSLHCRPRQRTAPRNTDPLYSIWQTLVHERLMTFDESTKT
jgi:hypothetical protein